MNISFTLSKAGWVMFWLGWGLVFLASITNLDLYVGEGGEIYDAAQLADRSFTFGLGNLFVITGAIFAKTGVKQ